MPVLLTDNTLNKIARTRANIVVNTANVLTQQTHTDELGANEREQHGKQHKDPFRRPLGTKDQPQNDQQNGKRKPGQRDNAAEHAQQAQRRGGQAGDQVVHQVDQTHEAVF